jgi:hypothetical protein
MRQFMGQRLADSILGWAALPRAKFAADQCSQSPVRHHARFLNDFSRIAPDLLANLPSGVPSIELSH